MDRLWHLLKLLKHGKIKLVCESLDEHFSFVIICPFLGTFDISVFRFQVWTVGPAGSRHRGSRQSLELCQQHMVSGIPAPWTKMVKYPKVLFQIFRTQKSTSMFFLFNFFSDNFSMSSDIRNSDVQLTSDPSCAAR